MLFKQFSFQTLRGGQGARDSSFDFLGAAAWVTFGSIIRLLLGLLASVIFSLAEDIFEIQRGRTNKNQFNDRSKVIIRKEEIVKSDSPDKDSHNNV